MTATDLHTPTGPTRRTRLTLAGAAFALSLGFVACSTTPTNPGGNVNTGLYPLTVKFTGASGAQAIKVDYPTGGSDKFTMNSGGILKLAAGTYNVTAPTNGNKSPATQTVTLGADNPSQEITFAY